ncbi:hypothetical protein [Sphingobium sp. ba1]|uniref:hypothetical protein n=1 Tax=Sphingobium sp. ba1 TaxID=1522072 RepID=UPI000A6A546C|nr:hypothetical protein [Sphingobium sp. ba1]
MEYRSEITRRHHRKGGHYHVRYLDLRNLHPIDRRRLEWAAWADPDLQLAVERTRADLIANGWS